MFIGKVTKKNALCLCLFKSIQKNILVQTRIQQLQHIYEFLKSIG